MKHIFAIGVGGTGAKCIEAVTHLHACGLFADESGNPARLGIFLVEPDQQSALLNRAQTAVGRYVAMRRLIGTGSDDFARGELRDYGQWSPLSSASGAMSLDQVFPKAVLRTQSAGLADLFDCLFPPDEQSADLEVGFRGRPPIGSAVMSRVSLEKEAQVGRWQQMLNDIQTAAGSGEPPVIHLFGSVFGGTGASGVPSLGQLLKNWLKRQGLNSVQVQASLLLPYFDFDGMGDQDTGVHAESRNFQLNTDAALQYLRTSGKACFDRVYLIGSDIKARYGFSIGGVSQSNAAHLVELLGALALRHPGSVSTGYAYVLSRADAQTICWEDIPDNEIVGAGLARGARFAVAWRNNFSREIGDAQKVSMPTFLSGAPWARRFFSTRSKNSTGTNSRGARPPIRDKEGLSIQNAIDQYCDTLLQWLNQISSNLGGSNFHQELFTPSLLTFSGYYINSLNRVVQGKARPNRSDSADTVERIKVRMDCLSSNAISHRGMAGLADCLWKLVL
ncbi:MAG: hypothetical protein FJ060_03185 [Cyanobacteria bacterium K_Offshore_0m_m2_072]|nr:hypothetical protein [Cyanobacteria bacterium K_Offshore_0m_m2_072]